MSNPFMPKTIRDYDRERAYVRREKRMALIELVAVALVFGIFMITYTVLNYVPAPTAPAHVVYSVR